MWDLLPKHNHYGGRIDVAAIAVETPAAGIDFE
jgi:hypothetical protein